MNEYDDYLGVKDKPFAENINTALLLSNVFDLTVPIELPLMFRSGEWDLTSNATEKASVAIIETVDATGISTDGNNNLVGTGTLKFNFYPNFNSYGGISKVEWTAVSGTITIDIYDADGQVIKSDIPNGDIGSVSSAIRELQNFEFRVNFTSATLSDLKITMVNNQETRWGAEVGISDVTGLQASLDAKLDKSSVHFVTLTASSYNVTIDNSVTLTCKVTDSTGSPIEDYEVQLYKNGTSLGNDYKADTDSSGEATFTYQCTEWGIIDFNIENTHTQIRVKGWRQLRTFGTTGVVSTDGTYVRVSCNDTISNVPSRFSQFIATIPTGYEPPTTFAVEASADQAANHKFLVESNGDIKVSNALTSVATIGLYNSILYPIKE